MNEAYIFGFYILSVIITTLCAGGLIDFIEKKIKNSPKNKQIIRLQNENEILKHQKEQLIERNRLLRKKVIDLVEEKEREQG